MKTMNFRRAMPRIFCSLILFCTTFLVASLTASAAPITVPASLSPGSQYRLAFVTSTFSTDTSTNIADYNTFVTTAANSVSELQALVTTWTAIGSTHDVAARDNTGTNPSSTGVPVFTLGGDLIAANNAALWSGTISRAINVDPAGNVVVSNFPLSGTNTDGTSLASPEALGESAPKYGNASASDSTWLLLGNASSAQSGQLYGISGVLAVPVPEPGSIFLTSIAVAGLVVSSLRQRRHGTARAHVVRDLR